MLALVTGVAGFIGSQLAEHVRSAGWRVRGVDSFTPYYDRAIKESNLVGAPGRGGRRARRGRPAVGAARTVARRRRRGLPLRRPTGRAGVVGRVHDLQRPQPRRRPTGSCRQSRRRRLQRFVFASSSSVYGQSAEPVAEDAPTRPFNPYGVTKLAAESLCRAYAENFGVPTVVAAAVHRLRSAPATGHGVPPPHPRRPRRRAVHGLRRRIAGTRVHLRRRCRRRSVACCRRRRPPRLGVQHLGRRVVSAQRA